jgi:hypothetical protein
VTLPPRLAATQPLSRSSEWASATALTARSRPGSRPRYCAGLQIACSISLIARRLELAWFNSAYRVAARSQAGRSRHLRTERGVRRAPTKAASRIHGCARRGDETGDAKAPERAARRAFCRRQRASARQLKPRHCSGLFLHPRSDFGPSFTTSAVGTKPTCRNAPP